MKYLGTPLTFRFRFSGVSWTFAFRVYFASLTRPQHLLR